MFAEEEREMGGEGREMFAEEERERVGVMFAEEERERGGRMFAEEERDVFVIIRPYNVVR